MPVIIGKNGFPQAVPAGTLPVRVSQSPGITNAQNARMIRARFDNQLTTDDNRQLWSLADTTSVDAAANYGVRRTLRMRGRYGYHNNPIVQGVANRLANFVIGATGPKLHMSTTNAKVNDAVERAWEKWSRRVQLTRKLKVSRAARFYNGEGFNLLRTNPKIKGPIKLDVFEIEADQVGSPLFGAFPAAYPDQQFDGLILDPWGNREVYHVLRQHPGAFGAFLTMGYEFDAWPAQYVLHDYGHLRPAQQRGIPEVTPALDLFEEARRYRRAVLAAAETAADHAGFIQTDAPAEETAETGWGSDADYINIKRRTMGVLPKGWNAFQMKSEQPTQGYQEYFLHLMAEAAQTIDMPLFIVSGDARLANMSSAYVATQPFVKRVKSERVQDYNPLLDQTFDEWLAEARRVPGLIPAECPDDPDHDWRWERVSDHADPSKMASAQNQRLKNGASPSILFADDGMDFEEGAARAAGDYGVTVEEYKAALFASIFASRGTPPPSAINPDVGNAPENPEAGDEEEDANAHAANDREDDEEDELKAFNDNHDDKGQFAEGPGGGGGSRPAPAPAGGHGEFEKLRPAWERQAKNMSTKKLKESITRTDFGGIHPMGKEIMRQELQRRGVIVRGV